MVTLSSKISAPKPRSLLNYAARYGFNTPEIKDNCIWLRESGYLRAQHENVTLIVDIARLGPDYQLGHAHADTLSFELSIFGRRLVVNSGTSDYNIGSTRQHQRSTRAHNTVEINDRNSSEMWASFRVARRASPFDIKVKKGKKKIKGGCIIDAKNDHRISMSFNILSLITEEPIFVRGNKSIITSFPDFFKNLNELGADSAIYGKQKN